MCSVQRVRGLRGPLRDCCAHGSVKECQLYRNGQHMPYILVPHFQNNQWSCPLPISRVLHFLMQSCILLLSCGSIIRLIYLTDFMHPLKVTFCIFILYANICTEMGPPSYLMIHYLYLLYWLPRLVGLQCHTMKSFIFYLFFPSI